MGDTLSYLSFFMSKCYCILSFTHHHTGQQLCDILQCASIELIFHFMASASVSGIPDMCDMWEEEKKYWSVVVVYKFFFSLSLSFALPGCQMDLIVGELKMKDKVWRHFRTDRMWENFKSVRYAGSEVLADWSQQCCTVMAGLTLLCCEIWCHFDFHTTTTNRYNWFSIDFFRIEKKCPIIFQSIQSDPFPTIGSKMEFNNNRMIWKKTYRRKFFNLIFTLYVRCDRLIWLI